MDGLLGREVTTVSECMSGQLLADREVVTMDVATLKAKIIMTYYCFIGEEKKDFPFTCFYVCKGLWYQKLLELSLLSAHEGENCLQWGKKMYHICPMKKAWRRELLTVQSSWVSEHSFSFVADQNRDLVHGDIRICFLSVGPKIHFFPLDFTQNNKQTRLSGNSSSPNHKAFLLVGRGNLSALLHRDSPGVSC